MTDQIQQSASQTLMHAMRLDDASVAAIKDLVTQHTDEYVTTFFNHLSGLDEARPLLATPAIAARARQLKSEHLVAMVQGDYGAKYVEQRLELGSLYARAGLDPRVFLGAFHQLLRQIGVAVMKKFERTSVEGFENFMSLKKVAFFDIGTRPARIAVISWGGSQPEY